MTGKLFNVKGYLLYPILLPFLFASLRSDAQGTVRGIIVDGNEQPMYNASVLLLNSKDSVLIKGAVTPKTGSFLFEKIIPGSYLVACSYTGFKHVYSPVFFIDSIADFNLTRLKLFEKEAELTAVTVTAKKPMFEQKIDRMIINVASSITSAGSTALDVLMRSPGVIVDQRNNTLSINGKDGVVIMLNGKANRLPLTAVVQMLAGMNSANIERIELITTPPANFDAEGNAGFINIVLKSNSEYGTNGSFSVTAGYGLGAGPVVGSSVNFNHRTKKVVIYGDYSYGKTDLNLYGTMYRKVINGSNTIENFMDTDRDDFRRNHNGRLGVDYEISKKTTLGILVSGFSNLYGMQAVNKSNIFLNGKLDTNIIINNPERHPLDNYSANVNLLQRFTTNEQLSVNVDYMFYRDANRLDYLNHFYNSTGIFLYENKTRSSKVTPIKFWVGTADYTKSFGEKLSLEAGIKGTISRFQNDVKVEREVQANWVPDKDLTAMHHLNESIFAAYTSFNIKISAKTNSKIGLRYEYTNSNLDSETKRNIVDRHYGNWFPTLFLSHAIDEKNSLNFSYNRRITRPTFNDMAPFIYFVDPNTFFSGNPALQPSLANAVKADYLYKRLIFSISYTREKNTITNFSPRVDPVTNKQTLAAENQKGQHIVVLTLALPFTITAWWTMQNNLSAQWQELHAFYKSSPLRITQKSILFNSTQTFILPKDYSIECSGYYQSGGLFGVYKIRSMRSLNIGVQKKLSEKSGTLRLAMNEILTPPHLRFAVDAPEQNLVTSGDFRFANTNVRLTYTRNFGSDKVKAGRTRSTGSEQERQRIQVN